MNETDEESTPGTLLPDLLNDEGFPVNLGDGGSENRMYCGRRLGVNVIPESDGRCGPSNGPNCPSCRRLQGTPSTRLMVLRRLFPRLAKSNDDDATTAFLVKALRCGSGRVSLAVKLLQDETGLTAVTPRNVALSAKRIETPDPPHLTLTGTVARQVEGLRDSLQVPVEVAEFALRNSDYDANEAAEFILSELEEIQEELVAESEERNGYTRLAEEWNEQRRVTIQRALAQAPRDTFQLPAGGGTLFSPIFSLDNNTETASTAPLPVVVVKGHRMMLLGKQDEDAAAASGACVLCSSPVPSVFGGQYRCQACLLCEGCVQSSSNKINDEPTGGGIVLKCPGPTNGGHLHPHPLVFTTERSNCECDVEGPGCIQTPVSWTCVPCEYDVCRVCISQPPPRGYNRRLNRITNNVSRMAQEEGGGEDADEWDENSEIAAFFSGITGLFEDTADDDEDDAGPGHRTSSIEFDPPLPPRGPRQQAVSPEEAEREVASVWESNIQSTTTHEMLLGTGMVGTVESRPLRPGEPANRRPQDQATQQVPLLPAEGLLSAEASGALDLYRTRPDASTIAAADVTHVEDLLRRAQAVDNRLTHGAIRDAIASGRLGIAGTLLLSQAYAPVSNSGGDQENANVENENMCWCGELINAQTAPDGAVGCLGGHAMHAACAADLLLGGGNCPTCRQPLFFSKVAGPEARAAVEFAKEEIRKGQLAEKQKVQQEIDALQESGSELNFSVDDVVLVSPEVDICRQAQIEDPIAGGWEEDMAAACGLEGRVTDIVEDGGKKVSVRVRSMGRHRYKKIMRVDDYSCPECNSTLLGHRCRNCHCCESCCRRTLRSCPQNTHEWNWSPKVLSLLRRGGRMDVAHETVFGSEATAAVGMAERHILRLRGELIAVKKAREAVKEETDKFASSLGLQKVKMSRELSVGSSAAVQDMAVSGVSAPDWQRARHLLLLARQWGDSDEAKAERAALYKDVRRGDLDSVARRVRGYNASRAEDSAKWADATQANAEYYVEPFARVDLRAFPDIAAPKTGYSLAPLYHFTTKCETLDKNGRLWLQISVPSIDEMAVLDGRPVTRALAWVGAVVRRGQDWTFGSQDGGSRGEGVITRLTDSDAYVRWERNSRSIFSYPLSTDSGPKYLLFVGSPPSPPPQGFLCVRPDEGSRALVVRAETRLRCFSCGDRLIPSKPVEYETVKGKSVKKGDRLLVAATLEPVTVEASRAGYVLSGFGDGNPEDFGVWYRPEDLVFPCSDGVSSFDADEETVAVQGQMRTRQEIFIMCDRNEAAARRMWDKAKKEDKTLVEARTFASCARGHLLHARCFQAALVSGHRCPAAGCREALWVPSVSRARGENDDTQCGGATRGTLDETDALQTSFELAGHAAIAAVRLAEEEGTQHHDAGFDSLKMCPLCCSGPLFNNNCSDMMAHHGQCSVMALRDGRELMEECTPDGDFRAPASEIAARVAQISETRTVADVLPKCPKHNALVMFNGCMACGHLFTDTSWGDMPRWDPSAKALLDSDRKKRNAARLLTEQIRTEAALLQFERDSLWEAGGSGVGVDAGWGGTGLDAVTEPPPIPPPPSLPISRNSSSSGDY